MRPDIGYITQTVNLFLQDGCACELRIMNTEREGTISGYYSDRARLASDIMALSGKGPGIYLTINPVPADLLARAKNRYKTRVRVTTSDTDVTRRVYLLLDFDPLRSTGISSTEEEHTAAIECAIRARETLSREGWPLPVVADSGNGCHLLYRIDLPNDAESTELVKGVLKGAAQRFNTSAIEVDEAVFNAARISKVYGTISAKGDSTDERPHRVSSILSLPDVIDTVPRELLQALADEVKKEPAKQQPARFNGLSVAFDVDAWAAKHQIKIERGPVPYEGGDKWVLANCPFNPDHAAPDSAIFRTATGKMGFKCLHASCADKTWTEFRALYDGPRPERNTADAAEILSASLDKVMAGSVEDAYSHELVHAMAMVHVSGGRSHVLRGIERLQGKFKKDFKTNLFKAKVTEETERLRLDKITVARAPDGSWENQIIRKQGRDGEIGGPAPCEANAALYFRHHPAWKDKLGWNEFTGEMEVIGTLPVLGLNAGEPLKDIHAVMTLIWLQTETQEPKFGIESVRHGMAICAHEHSFHPVKDMLEALPPWDGVPRLGGMLARYCGAGPADSDDSPEAVALASFVSATSERFMISAVARVYQPGCEVHHVLVLEGAKGVGKSTMVRILFGPWSGSMTGDVGTKDSQAMLSSGVWCLEFEELGVLGKSAMQSVKAFVTRPFEFFRPVWGHHHERRPRQVVFLATVDREDWADEDDRRWWPVKCKGGFDLEGLAADRPLLWAEALARYKAGQRWHFHAEEDKALIVTAKGEQAWRVQDHVLMPQVTAAAAEVAESRLSNLYGTCSVAEVLDKMQIPLERRKALGVDVGKCLIRGGWSVYRVRISGKQVQRYNNLELYPTVRQ